MQTMVASVVYTNQKTSAGELSLFAMSEKKILDEIYATHVHTDESFDDDSLLIIVKNILKRATQTVDKIVQGTQVHMENIKEKSPEASFSVPLCTLEGISCEMQCKPPGAEIAHSTTLAILNKLSKYSWEAKASLTLAAFAMEYGEFWLLAQLRESDHLAKSIAILKRVPILLEPSQLLKRRQSIFELNNLIMATLQVIEYIDEFNKSSCDPKDVPDLSIALDHIPVDVYWAMVTVVACATKVTLLTSDEDKEYDLAPYSQKIYYVLNKLKNQLIQCREQIEEAKDYERIKKLFQTPTEIMEVLKGLIFRKDNVQPLIDGSTTQTVKIDILRRKNVLLFISSLDISDDDILILKPIHEFTKKDNQYKIVWIPIVEKWTDDLRKKCEILKNKMPWYTVQYSVRSASIKFIKEDWHFKGKPTMVVINPQGKVEHSNALHMIRLWGVNAFPFTKPIEDIKSDNWVHLIFSEIHPSVPTWIKEGKYIFFYGGKDNKWIDQFEETATALANDPIFMEANIHLQLVFVGEGSKGEPDHSILGGFWSSVESLFFTAVHKQVDSVSQEIQKLFSYKNENGWALLSKGSTVLMTGHGVLVLKVVEEFVKWKGHVKERGFENCFKEYYQELHLASPPCCSLEISGSTGKCPESMKCPICPRSMETFISYKCCHIDGPTALSAHH